MICYRCCNLVKPDRGKLYGLHSTCFKEWFEEKKAEEFHDVAMRNTASDEAQFCKINTSFFQGKFRKYSARLGEKAYILKVEQEEFAELPLCEYLCNQIAKILGLEVPRFFLIRFHGLRTFVSQNFMHNRENSNLVHIYRFLDDKDCFDCETLKNIIEAKTSRIIEVEKFINVCLFDALIGNHDRHGRNLGLIQTADSFVLSPIYDNPSYIGMEIPMLLGARHEPKGVIVTRATGEPTLKDYIQEWRRLGYDDVVSDWFHRLKKYQDQILLLVTSSFMSRKRIEAFRKLVGSRIQEAENEF